MVTAIPTLIQPGDLLVTNITGDVGKWIGFGEFLDSASFDHPFNRELRELDVFSHAAVYVGDGNIVEAEVGGARSYTLDEYLDGRPLMFSTGLLGVDAATGLKIAAEAKKLIGVPYSFVDYAAIATHRLHLPAPGLEQYIKDSGHLICSQLADLAYQRAGVQLFADNRWNGDVTPMDIARLLVSKGATP
jgi:cell wall-associated NlpC family hydrolase